LYVSRWNTPKAAERFATFYVNEVPQRYHTASADDQLACGGEDCPISRVEIATEEGPVIVEQWTGNRVVISEGFDSSTAAKLRGALREGATGTHARRSSPHRNSNYSELGFRLAELPAFQEFQALIGARIREQIKPGWGR
jgi:hypothetical protein